MINFAIKLAATVAMEAVQVGLQASQRTKGPRLDELTVTVADYGTPLPRFLGARRFSCPVFHAEDLKEVEQTTKAKGGKSTTYHYLATFAVAIADNPIDKVLKIWFDDKLVYDVTGPGPVSLMSAILGAFGGGSPSSMPDLSKIMRIYLGTETQLPDPRYSAWCEDKYGPNSAPAYRGVSYLFFEELPVDNFGNRIPQISVLAASATAAAYPYDVIAKPGNLSNEQFSQNGDRLYFIAGTAFQAIDVASKALVVNQTVSAGFDVGAPYAVTDSGIYGTGGSDVVLMGLDGGSAALGYTGVAGWAGCSLAGDQVLFYPSGVIGNYVGTLGAGTINAIAVNHMATHYFTDAEGASVAVGTTSGNILAVASPATAAATLINTSAYGSSGAAYGFDNGKGQYVVRQGVHLLLVDKATHAIAGHHADAVVPSMIFADMDSTPVGATTFWNGIIEYSASDLSVVQTVNPASWPVTLPAGAFEAVGYLYDPIDHALISLYNGAGTTQGIVLRYLDRAANAGVTLGQIVDAMCAAAAMTERDTSLLTQVVQGYSWTRGDVKSQMEPLLDIHDVDARPHDFTIHFLPRGSAPIGGLLTQDFGKSADGTRYKVTIAQDTDLPQMLRVNFADTGFDQQTNNVLSPLPTDSVDSQRDDTIDLTTYAASPAEAQQLADRYMRRQWNSRESIENALTAQSLALEPGDVTTLDLDGVAQNARLIKQSFSGGRIDCTFIRDETSFAALNTATTGPVMDPRTIETIQIPSPVKGFVVDAPYASDSDADVRPLLYAGAGAYATLSYPGSVIYQASAGVYDQLFATFVAGSAWALCNSVLKTANANLWDRGNTLNVTLESGSLTSVAEADINADPELNLVLVGSPAVGWEYLNFATATLNGDGSYTLSDLKRGRRGTEWMCGLHVSGELLVQAKSLAPEEMGTDDIGNVLSFKAQAIGRSVADAAAITLSPYTGATLKPYAPARVKWAWDGTNLTGSITRRTRIGGAWVGGATIPLSENAEAYDVDIYNGATFKRTISVSGTNVFTYTAAMAAADGITLPTPPPIKAYQISDAAGRGFALAA